MFKQRVQHKVFLALCLSVISVSQVVGETDVCLVMNDALEPVSAPAIAVQSTKQSMLFQDYFDRYFPKAFVIRDFWAAATPQEVFKALDTIVNVLAYEPSYYFTNPGTPFKISHYWEHIVDQLSLMSAFFEEAYIDCNTGSITKPENIDPFSYIGFGNLKDCIALATALCEQPGSSSYYAFYALCFDYVVKLFNEGILLLDIGQAMRYYPDLEFIVGKLRGSVYEAEYQEHLKTAKELMNLLKQKLGIQDDLLEPSAFGSRGHKFNKGLW